MNYVKCPKCNDPDLMVKAGFVCFDCAYPSKREREWASSRLRDRLESKWRRFPLEAVGLYFAAAWIAWRSSGRFDLAAAALVAAVATRWLRSWIFVLILALGACGGGAFHGDLGLGTATGGMDQAGGAAVVAAGGEAGESLPSIGGGPAAGQAGAPSSTAGALGLAGMDGVGGAAGTTTAGGANSGGSGGHAGSSSGGSSSTCLASWQGSSCDTCTSSASMPGQTCAEIVDCYAANHCGPGCDCEYQKPTSDAVVKVARAVYACRCP